MITNNNDIKPKKHQINQITDGQDSIGNCSTKETKLSKAIWQLQITSFNGNNKENSNKSINSSVVVTSSNRKLENSDSNENRRNLNNIEKNVQITPFNTKLGVSNKKLANFCLSGNNIEKLNCHNLVNAVDQSSNKLSIFKRSENEITCSNNPFSSAHQVPMSTAKNNNERLCHYSLLPLKEKIQESLLKL